METIETHTAEIAARADRGLCAAARLQERIASLERACALRDQIIATAANTYEHSLQSRRSLRDRLTTQIEELSHERNEALAVCCAVDRSTARWLAADRYPCHGWERLRLVRPDCRRARRAAVAMEKRDLGQYVAFVALMDSICSGRVHRGTAAGRQQ